MPFLRTLKTKTLYNACLPEQLNEAAMLVQHHMNKALPVHQPDLLNTSFLREVLTLYLDSLSQHTPLEETHLAIASYGQMLGQLSHMSLYQQHYVGPC